MDLYLLFFATATTSSASPRSRNALTSQGMVSLYCMELINSLREAVLETCGSNNSMYSSVDDVQRIFFAGESVSGTWKSVLQPWLQQTLKIVTNRCKQALSGLVSAAEVSQLQQIVWRCATNTSIQSASQRIESCKEQSSYTQETWERASMFLLASLNKTSLPSMKVANERSISSSAILWGVAFRSSFTHQVFSQV